MTTTKIIGISAKNWLIYDQIDLKITAPITVIRGLNLDSSASDGLNRVGKSIVPGIIPRLKFGAMPQPLKSSKRGKQAFRSGTVLNLDLQRDANFYRIQGYFDRTSRLRIIEDKRNRGIRLKADATEALAQLFPHNEDQFYATVYIDGRRPSPFQYGTDAQRFEFFENVFGLGVYKALNEMLKPDLQTGLRTASERDVLVSQLSELGDPIDIAALRSRLAQRQNRLENQRTKVESWRSHKRRLDVYLSALQNIPDGKIEDTDALVTQMNAISERIDNALKAQEQQRLFEQTTKTRAAIMSELKSLQAIAIDQGIVAELERIRADCDAAETELQTYQEARDAYLQAARTLDGIKTTDKIKQASQAALRAELIKVENRLAFIDRLTSVLSGDVLEHEKTCPICANTFDAAEHTAFMQRMKTSHETLQRRRALLNEGLTWHQHNAHAQMLKSEIVKPTRDHAALQKSLRDTEAHYQTMKRKAALQRRLKELPEIEAAAEIEDVAVLRAENRDLLNRHTRTQKIEQAQAIVKNLKIGMSRQEAVTKHAQLRKHLPENECRLDALESECLDLRTTIRDAEQAEKRAAHIREQIEAYDAQLQDQPIYEALRAAFGPRGLIKQRTQDIATSFEKALNEYADYVFDEPITFRLEVTETKFSVLATRNKIEDDVRSLCGQESRAFSLIVLLALLRFMPAHLRCNTIVLDEIEANMDAPSKALVADKLLPELLRFVDHVLVITPDSRSEFYIPDAVEYYAVKYKAKSRLVPFEALQSVQAAFKHAGKAMNLDSVLAAVAKEKRA